MMFFIQHSKFVEIKGSLFKRIDRNNLLRISCSDVRERFHLSALLFIVFVRNMTEFNWNYGMAVFVCVFLPTLIEAYKTNNEVKPDMDIVD